MPSNICSSKIYTHIQTNLYNYFQHTPHFVFMNVGFPTVSNKLLFPNVTRITIIKSNHLLIKNMIHANIFPNLNYIRELVHISTSDSQLIHSDKLLHNMVEHNIKIVDYEVSFLDFTNSLHLDIKKISNNFSGFNIGNINNKKYGDYLYEYLTDSDDTLYDIQKTEELALQREAVYIENKRYSHTYLK